MIHDPRMQTTERTSARVATHDDAATLLSMMEDFNALEGIAWSRDRCEPALRALLSDASLGVVAIVEESREVVGYFVVTWGFDLEWNGRDAFLTEIYVVAAARARGLGRECLAHAEKIAKANGARALHLMVRDENEPARKLYARAGYTSPPRIFLTKEL
jgi:ribosomal protein S18 acetylase RimI-like enzyme